MPEGTLAGGGMPGPTLGTQSAAAGRVVCVDAFARVGAKLISTTRIAAAQERRRLRRPGLRLCGIDAELRDGLRDIGGTRLPAKGARVLRNGGGGLRGGLRQGAPNPPRGAPPPPLRAPAGATGGRRPRA